MRRKPDFVMPMQGERETLEIYGWPLPPNEPQHSNINECRSCKRMFVDGETCPSGGCPMGGDV